MSELRCKVCDSENVQFVFSEAKLDLIHRCYYCASCDLYQTLGDVAPISPDYVGLQDSDLGEQHSDLQRTQKHSAFAQWFRTIRRLSDQCEPGFRSILDIGCGIGGFLEFAASKGFRTYGFDASTAQVRVARASFSNVRQSIDIYDYVAQLDHVPTFDLVTMWDVFEHIRDPRSLLKGIRPYMAPTGLLFVSVPSGAPTRFKLIVSRMAGRPPGLIPWEHVFYYTKRSLRKMLEANSFDVLSIDGVVPYGRPLTIHEVVRRTAHRLLAPTPWALQVCAFSRPKMGSVA